MAEVKCHRVYIIGIAFTYFLHDKEVSTPFLQSSSNNLN